MPKNILQDIVPPEKRSIRNIPLPNRGNKTSTPIVDVKTKAPEPKIIEKAPIVDTVKTKNPLPPVLPKEKEEEPRVYPYGAEESQSFFESYGGKKMIIGAIIVSVFIVVFAVASLFSSATVTVFPHKNDLKVSSETTFSAKKNPTGDELGFQLVKITKSLGKEVPATGEEKMERKASGTIVVYNNFDAKDQRLIKNTRFETPEGLIYRINESIVVPGKKQDAPGSVEVMVYADEVGEKYNIGKVDFTIPGFKGDPRFKEIYARSKTDMTGGFVGMVKKVSEADSKAAQEELRVELEKALKQEVSSQVPQDFILFDDGVSFSFNSLPQSDDKGSTVKVNEEGVLFGILFNRDALVRSMASKMSPEILKNPITAMNLDSLKFTLKDKAIFDGNLSESINFTFEGDLTFVSDFDEERLKGDLNGQPKSNIDTILANYPAIKEARAIIRPFWKRTFPSNSADIVIKITE